MTERELEIVHEDASHRIAYWCNVVMLDIWAPVAMHAGLQLRSASPGV